MPRTPSGSCPSERSFPIGRPPGPHEISTWPAWTSPCPAPTDILCWPERTMEAPTPSNCSCGLCRSRHRPRIESPNTCCCSCPTSTTTSAIGANAPGRAAQQRRYAGFLRPAALYHPRRPACLRRPIPRGSTHVSRLCRGFDTDTGAEHRTAFRHHRPDDHRNRDRSSATGKDEDHHTGFYPLRRIDRRGGLHSQ